MPNSSHLLYIADTSSQIGIYSALGVSQALLMFLFSVTLTTLGTISSKVMLDRAMTRVLRAPMRFFDTTPLGRITNRFSKDVDTMDNTLTVSACYSDRSCVAKVAEIGRTF